MSNITIYEVCKRGVDIYNFILDKNSDFLGNYINQDGNLLGLLGIDIISFGFNANPVENWTAGGFNKSRSIFRKKRTNDLSNDIFIQDGTNKILFDLWDNKSKGKYRYSIFLDEEQIIIRKIEPFESFNDIIFNEPIDFFNEIDETQFILMSGREFIIV